MKNWLKLTTFCACLLCFILPLVSCQSRVGPPETPSRTLGDDGGSAAQRLAQAERLYAEREDLARVRQGIALLRQARTADSTNYDVMWRLAEFNYYLGAHSSDGEEQYRAFREGIEAGKLAVKLQDGKPDGHFWLGANYGGRAKISMLGALTAIEDVRHEMDLVIKLDESYDGGSAYMVLGRTYLEAPVWFGRDGQKAIQYLERGLRFDPRNAITRLSLAKAYLAVNRKEDARKQLDELFAQEPNPAYLPEYNETVAEARKLRERLN